MRKQDALALERAERFGMSPDLRIPIAAKNKEAVSDYVGNITPIFKNTDRALLVEIDEQPARNIKLPIWRQKGVDILHKKQQVWVHVDYHSYRRAYSVAFPWEELSGLVIDHILNRRVARLRNFEYVRVIPISRVANSSSGNVTEKYGFAYHSTEPMKQTNSERQPFIQYCDIAGVIKMLDIKTGGSYQDGIRDCLYFFFEE